MGKKTNNISKTLSKPSTPSKTDSNETTSANTQEFEDEEEDSSEKNDTPFLLKAKIGTINIPNELERGIQIALRGINRDTLRREGSNLSEMLRARTSARESITTIRTQGASGGNQIEKKTVVSKEDIPPISYTTEKAMAYLAHRMPGVYGTLYRVLNEVSMLLPEFQPKTMLDFGSGPGTAIWSAKSVWKDSDTTIQDVLAIEPSSPMIEMAEKMLSGFQNRSHLNIQWRRFLLKSRNSPKFDLVTASYVMSELKDDKERQEALQNLWESVEVGGILVIVEPGTPVGFGIVRSLRQNLLEFRNPSSVKSAIVAPCPHSVTCPSKWCHFSQRVERIPLTLGAKLGSSQSWEDEKFSYIVMRKDPKNGTTEIIKHQQLAPNNNNNNNVEQQQQQDGESHSTPNNNNGDDGVEWKWSRLIKPPIKCGGHVILDLCLPTGVADRRTVARSYGKDYYRSARKSGWGDAIYLRPKSTH